MAGRMGQDQVTVRNIRIVAVDDDFVLIKGLVPGGRNTLLTLKKVGEDKKFVPLYAEKVEPARNASQSDAGGEVKTEEKIEEKPEEVKAEETKVEEKKEKKLAEEVKAEIKEEVKPEIKEEVK